MLPIAMTTYTANNDSVRLNYFENSIKSLEGSNADLSKLCIFDDCSENENKKKVLKQLSEKYTIINNDHTVGTYVNTRLAVDYLYDNYESKYLISIQDDIQVNKYWIDRAVQIADKIIKETDKFGILSLFQFRMHTKNLYGEMETGHPGAVCWLIGRAWWREFRDKYPMNHGELMLSINDRMDRRSRVHLADYKICHCLHLMKWKLYFLGKSLVQHMGCHSSLSKRNMTFTQSKNFVGINGN